MANGTPPSEEAFPTVDAEQGAQTRWPTALRALRHRNFRLFWIGLLISVTGTWMQAIAQGWLVLQLTDSPLYLGIVGACGSAPMLFISLPAGVLADRVKKRNLLLVTQTLAMLQAFVLAALIFAHMVQVWHVILLAIFLGIVNAIDVPARQAMVVELSGKEDLFNAVSLNASAFNTGRIIGPALAGVIIAGVGMANCFLLNGISFLAIIIMIALIPPRPPAVMTNGSMLLHIGEGLQWARGDAVTFALLILTAASSIFAMPYATVLPVFARDVFHTGAQGYGGMMSAFGVGALVAAVLMAGVGHRVRLGRFVTTAALLFPLMLIAVALAPRYPAAVICLFASGLTIMTFNAVSNTMLQTAPPDALRGRIMSLRAFVFFGLAPLGNLQVGAIAEWLGPRAALALGGTICLLAAMLIVLKVPSLPKSE